MLGHLVVHMSRKHKWYAYALMGTVDRRGYGGLQKGTICDVLLTVSLDLTHTEASFSPNSIDSL